MASNSLKLSLGVEKYRTIIVDSGDTYADTLTGSYLANVKEAPILLVNKYNETLIKNYIKSNLEPDGMIYLLGGTGAVSSEFQKSIESDYKVKRLGGADRFETNLKILKEVGTGGEDILVCSAWDFADSLSASSTGNLILITDTKLNIEQKDFIKSAQHNKCYLIGGKGAVSEIVGEEISDLGKQVYRIEGSNRYETSVKVAETFMPENNDTIILACGDDFPDGLVGGPLGYFTSAPLILANERNILAAKNYVNSESIRRAIVLGGPTLISYNSNYIAKTDKNQYNSL